MNLILHPPQDHTSPYLSFLYASLHVRTFSCKHMSKSVLFIFSLFLYDTIIPPHYFLIKILCFFFLHIRKPSRIIVKRRMCLAINLCMLMGYSYGVINTECCIMKCLLVEKGLLVSEEWHGFCVGTFCTRLFLC